MYLAIAEMRHCDDVVQRAFTDYTAALRWLESLDLSRYHFGTIHPA